MKQQLQILIYQNFISKTVNGCECKSQCRGRLDKVFDTCLVESSCEGANFDEKLGQNDCCKYTADQNQEDQTKEIKLKHLWDKINANRFPAEYPDSVAILSKSVWTTFTNVTDEIFSNKSKPIHSSGWTGLFNYQPSQSTNKQTGVFSHVQAFSGIIRFSFAKPWSAEQIVPSMSIKVLRSGVPSCNFMAMPSFDGQSNQDFFAYPFDNHVSPPKHEANQIIMKKQKQASNCPLCVGLYECARFDPGGNETKYPVYPFRISFISSLKSPINNTSQRDYDEFFFNLGRDPNKKKIFDVQAYDTPYDFSKDKKTLIGTINADSKFLTSEQGDKNLFFKHEWFENDIYHNISGVNWKEQFDEFNNCGVDCGTEIPKHKCN